MKRKKTPQRSGCVKYVPSGFGTDVNSGMRLLIIHIEIRICNQTRPWSHFVFINCSKPLTSEHMNIHTGEKPFQCDLCDFSCAARANLHSHKKNHHKTIPES